MASLAKRAVPFLGIALLSALMASRISSTGDWPVDSWPAIHSLTQGNLGDYLGVKAMMGPFSTLLQAPFAAMGGGDQMAAYQLASFPCLFAAGLLGLYLAAIARRRGVALPGQILIAGLCVANPLSVEALQAGHPEEILTSALAVGAIAAAADGKRGGAAVLLGLAIASKQWAVIAILPALMALPGARLRTGIVALGVVVAFTLPAFVASPETFTEVQDNAANTGRVVGPWSIWYPTASVRSEVVAEEPEVLTAHVHVAPPLVGALSHPLIVFLAVVVPLGLAWRRGGFRLDAGEAMALLALLALLRCALDPVDNVYYHAPLLLALIGWDAFSARGLPLRGLLGVAVALGFREWSLHLEDVSAYNRAYIAAILVAGAAITASLMRVPDRKLTFGWMKPKFRGSRNSGDGRLKAL
jgi:hypothetical protein